MLFEFLGGLSAVIYTDILQTLIMIIGSFILMIKGQFFLISKTIVKLFEF